MAKLFRDFLLNSSITNRITFMSNQFLEEFRRFVEMTPKDIIELFRIIKQKELKAGDFLIKAGQYPDHISVVQSGILRKYFIQENKERNVYFATEGDFMVDYPAYLQKKETSYYIQALEDTMVFTLHSSDIETKYDENPKWNFLGRKIAEDTIIKLYTKLEFMALVSPKERYNLFLEEYPGIAQRIPQYHIASYLQIEPQSLSRLKKRKLIY